MKKRILMIAVVLACCHFNFCNAQTQTCNGNETWEPSLILPTIWNIDRDSTITITWSTDAPYSRMWYSDARQCRVKEASKNGHLTISSSEVSEETECIKFILFGSCHPKESKGIISEGLIKIIHQKQPVAPIAYGHASASRHHPMR